MSNVTVYEELDLAVEAMLADAPRARGSEDAEIAMLCDIAAGLRHLPRPEFKASLMNGLLAEAALLALPARPRAAAADDNILPTLTGQGTSTYPVRRMNFAASLALHAAAVALLAASGMWVMDPAQPQTRPRVVSRLILDPGEYVLPAAPQEAAGGGGGGDRDRLKASKGSLPRAADKQFTPPTVIVRNLDPKLAVEPTVVLPPDIKLPQSAQMGDPLTGIVGPPSSGVGSGSGIGSGSRGGVGSGTGPGVGPGTGGGIVGPPSSGVGSGSGIGSGSRGGVGVGEGAGVGAGRAGGIGGGVFRIGGGVSAPRVVYNPDPEYSEEARKAKHQGNVVLWTIIGPDGRVRDVRVARSLGMGLDQKAIEAVRTWKFEPAMKNGRPVAVQVNIEVNFRLY